MAIKLVIDSSSDISKTEAKKLGVTMIPMVIGFGDEEFYDGDTLLPKQFYEKLTTSQLHPKTSQITAFRFEEVFEELTKNGDEVIAIVLSSGLSATYKSALLAANNITGKVYVVDSMNATAGERVLLEYALRLVKEGLSALEIVDKLNEVKGKIRVFGLLDTLEYLKKGGRISAATAAVGSALSIKPLISVIDGKVEVIGKAIGSKRGELMLQSFVDKTTGIDFNMPYCSVYTGTDDYAVVKFNQGLTSVWDGHKDDVRSFIIGSTIGVHVGPGVIGIVYFEK